MQGDTGGQRRFHAKNRVVYHASCAGNLTIDAPLQGDTGGHTGTAPTHLHHIFPRIPHKQNNHLHAIHQTKPTVHTQSTQTISTVPRTIRPNETVGAAPVCPPERPRSGVSIPKIHALYAGNLTMDAPPAGRHGRAHRHRPYPAPSNIAVCHYLITLYIR